MRVEDGLYPASESMACHQCGAEIQVGDLIQGDADTAPFESEEDAPDTFICEPCFSRNCRSSIAATIKGLIDYAGTTTGFDLSRAVRVQLRGLVDACPVDELDRIAAELTGGQP